MHLDLKVIRRTIFSGLQVKFQIKRLYGHWTHSNIYTLEIISHEDFSVYSPRMMSGLGSNNMTADMTSPETVK